MYKDTKGIQTVGVGHNLKNEKASAAAFEKAFGKDGAKIRKSVLSGSELTDDQVNKLFQVDYEEHRNRTANMITNLQDYPPDVQSVLVSGTFRGHVADSPNFRKLLAAGKYEEAANELLNREEYTRPNAVTGVKTRLERDANTIRGLAKKKEETKKEETANQAQQPKKQESSQQPKPPVTTTKTSNKPPRKRTK
jgi:hypothetical protein